MCAPAIALGAMSAGASVLGSVGQHQNQVAQANAANAASRRDYKYRMKVRAHSWDRERHRYSQNVSEYTQTIDENNAGYSDALAAEQNRLDNIYKQAQFNNQAAAVRLMAGQGIQAARGKAGKSITVLDTDIARQFGRNQAIQTESLLGASRASESRMQQYRKELTSANRRAYNQVAMAPVPGIAPPQPVMQQGPSGLGLAAGIMQGLVGGFQTANSLSPTPLF